MSASDSNWHTVISSAANSVSISSANPFTIAFADATTYELRKKVNLDKGDVYGGGLSIDTSGYFGGGISVGSIQVRGGLTAGTDAGKFLKLNDEDGNAVWATVPSTYGNTDVETWTESNLVTGDFSANGGSTAQIKTSLLPSLVITHTTVVTDGVDADTTCNNEITALSTATKGDVAICSTTNRSYILSTDSPTGIFADNWKELLATDLDSNPANEIQNITASQGLARDGSNNFGLKVCLDDQILKRDHKDTAATTDDTWECAADAQGTSYTLPAASASALGGIKVGSNLSVVTDGTLSAAVGGVGTANNSG